MREMRSSNFFGKHRTPLAVRGSLPRVFLSLGVFVEIGLLFLGSYLLSQALMKPLQASSATVVGGGVLLSLASVLLFYLLWPGKADSLSRQIRESEADSQGDFIEVSAKAIPEETAAVCAAQELADSTRGMETARFHAAAKAGR
jgi:hypothetical protein